MLGKLLVTGGGKPETKSKEKRDFGKCGQGKSIRFLVGWNIALEGREGIKARKERDHNVFRALNAEKI